MGNTWTISGSNEKALDSVAQSIENFTIDFYKNVAGNETGNFVCSALSAHVVLAMTAYGAQGITAEEMKKALHLPDEDSEAYLGFKSFIGAFNDVQKVILKLANKIYVNSEITVDKNFLKITKVYFRSQCNAMNVSKPDETAQAINQWCAKKTNGKIESILDAGDITPDLVLVLLNAVYFKGDWKYQFKEYNTSLKPFHVDKNTTIQVPTMYIEEKYLYRYVNEFNVQCIKLPYVNVRNIILKLANKIYINNKITVKDGFLKITEEYFCSRSECMDVSKPAETAKAINQWCVEKTDGKIQDIIPADAVTPDLALVLLNAVYFKGNWKDKFEDKYTEMKPFNVDKNTIIQVPTMHIKNKYSYRTIDELNAQCVKLPYENEDLEMEIIVPNEIDGLVLIENNLEKLNIDENKPYRKREIILALPKFKVISTIDLKPHLTEMGMGEIFSNKANFKGITELPSYVSNITQKAFIEVNEEGCEAAAVTVCEVQWCKKPLRPIQMSVDKPFIYRIVHKNNTVFNGRIVNPLVE